MNVAEKSTQMSEGKNIASALSSSGRIFRGTITKIFGQRAVIEFERTVKIQKYERFAKKKTRLHARIPEGTDVKIVDL
jgi:ribosomal protein S17